MTEQASEPANGHAANGKAKPDPRLIERMLDIVANEVTSRSKLISRLMDPRRNIDDECGYPRTESLTPQVYQELYDRDPIAARVVEVLAKESWKVQPTVYESEDSETPTEFEDAVDGLGKQIRGEGSWYQDEAGNPLHDYMMRLDVQSGIGAYGIMLIGIDDGLELDQPAEFNPGKVTRKLTFLRVFPEALAQITQYESDPTSPRYGQPVMYLVTFNDPSNHHGGVGLTTATKNVHWTRVVHVPSDLQSSEVFGVPRMRPVWNHLYNLRKLYGAGAEGYWKSCFTGLSFETNPALGGNVEIDMSAMRDMYEQYINGLDRAMVTKGMVVKTLAPSVVDPSSQIDAQLTAICIKLPCPKRVFMGSERGELASGQDEGKWDDEIKSRQNSRCTPRIVIPVYDRFISLGVLPEPSGYSVEWPDLTEQDATAKATITGLLMTALSTYVAGSVESLIAPMDVLTKFFGMDEEEASQIMENAAKAAEQKMEDDVAHHLDMIDKGLAPDPTAPKIVQAPPGTQPAEPVNPADEAVVNEWLDNLARGRWVELDWQPVDNWCNQHGGDSCISGSMSGTGGGTAALGLGESLADAVGRGEASLDKEGKSAMRSAYDRVMSKAITVGTHLLTDAAKEVADELMLHVTFNKTAGMPLATTAWQAGAWGAAKAYLSIRKGITGNEEAEAWQPL